MAEIITGIAALVVIIILGIKERKSDNVWNDVWGKRLK